MKNKVAVILIIIVLSLAVCGCSPNHFNLNERAMVQAIGIDFENDEYIITSQVFLPSGKTEGEGESQNTVYTTKGKTIANALNDIMLMQGRKTYIGNNKVVVLGESTAADGIEKVINYFDTNHETRLNTVMLVAKGKASDVVSAKIKQGVTPGDTIEKIVVNGRGNGKVVNVSLIDLLRSFYNDNKCGYIAAAKTEKDDEGNENIKIDGTAVFSGGALTGYLTDDETGGLMFIESKIKNAMINLETESLGQAGVRIMSVDTRCKTAVENETPVFTFEISVKGMIEELYTDDAYKIDSKTVVSQIEKALESKITEQASAVLNKLTKEYNADILGLGRKLRQKEPAFYESRKNNLQGMLKSCKFKIIVKPKIEASGVMNTYT